MDRKAFYSSDLSGQGGASRVSTDELKNAIGKIGETPSEDKLYKTLEEVKQMRAKADAVEAEMQMYYERQVREAAEILARHFNIHLRIDRVYQEEVTQA